MIAYTYFLFNSFLKFYNTLSSEIDKTENQKVTCKTQQMQY